MRPIVQVTDRLTLLNGDCLAVMRDMPDASVDAIVCDPPYGLSAEPDMAEVMRHWMAGDDYVHTGSGFMGKSWDSFVPGPSVWREALRVLKPGGHLAAFFGTRTYDIGTLAIRLAGFEVRDQLAWVYGSGFPKSLDVSKAIDKHDAVEIRRERALRFTAWMRSTGLTSAVIDALTETNMGGHYTTAASQPAVATREHFEVLRPAFGVLVPLWVEEMVDERTVESENFKAREVVGVQPNAMAGWNMDGTTKFADRDITTAHTPEAARWAGWGTALKPAWEPICLARKPLRSLDINVLETVEQALRTAGVEGPISWKKDRASVAESTKTQISLSSIAAPQAAAIFAVSAAGSENERTGNETPKSTESPSNVGLTPTLSESVNSLGAMTDGSGNKSSLHMGGSAPVAPNPSSVSSPSTTLTGAEPSTEKPFTARFIPNSDETAFPTAIGFFAGIATGLTGSTATVHIRMENDGSLIWPAHLPEVVRGGPLTVASNVLTHGTGGINVDGCRVGTEVRYNPPAGNQRAGVAQNANILSGTDSDAAGTTAVGRFPANLIHDGSDEVLAGFPVSGPSRAGKRNAPKTGGTFGDYAGDEPDRMGHDDAGGSAARFFYCAKASRSDRQEGNDHPTVKPTALMTWLCRLVTPPGGLVLDPFMGSGSTGKAAHNEGFRFVGIERDPDYYAMAVARIWDHIS